MKQNGGAAESLACSGTTTGRIAQGRSASSSAPAPVGQVAKLTGAPLVIAISDSFTDAIAQGGVISVQTAVKPMASDQQASIMMISGLEFHAEKFQQGQLDKLIKLPVGILINIDEEDDVIEQT